MLKKMKILMIELFSIISQKLDLIRANCNHASIHVVPALDLATLGFKMFFEISIIECQLLILIKTAIEVVLGRM